MRKIFFLFFLSAALQLQPSAQALRIPDNTNFVSSAGRKIGVTEVLINWNAPGVKGRVGKIWGTDIVPYGYTVLGFGSAVASPWRACADECTTISFSTDVIINNVPLQAGKYAFFIAVYPDSCTLIFNKNTDAWGAYFYNKDLDVVQITTKQQKNIATLKERLDYTFNNQKENAVEIALEWEHWKIPFTVTVNLKETVLVSIQKQLSGAIGFDPASLESGASWCLKNNINYEQALGWINAATMPSLGGKNTFSALNTKAGLLEKMGKTEEAIETKKQAFANATIMEIHGYARRLLDEGKKEEAMKLFEENYKKYNGAWPTNAGMMRGYAALGNYKKALEHAKKALAEAPDEGSKNAIRAFIASIENK